MEPRRNSSRTIRRKAKRKARSQPDKSKLSASTMQIPVEAVFGNLPKTQQAHLDVTCPGMDPMRLPLNSLVNIGRDRGCDVSLPLSNVSREHANISPSGEEFVLQDLDSTNGTFVNNVRVSRCVLRDHDIIRIGEALIKFHENKK